MSSFQPINRDKYFHGIIPFHPKTQQRARYHISIHTKSSPQNQSPTTKHHQVKSPKNTARRAHWMDDPSMVDKQKFQHMVKSILCEHQKNNSNQPDVKPTLMFPEGTPVVLNVYFKIKAPLTHFHRKIRDHNGLREDKKNCWPGVKDIDNLDKFVLDAFQGIFYHNDRQVVAQNVAKMYHHNGSCEGEIEFEIFQPTMPLMLNN